VKLTSYEAARYAVSSSLPPFSPSWVQIFSSANTNTPGGRIICMMLVNAVTFQDIHK